jgi:hypothetical protein
VGDFSAIRWRGRSRPLGDQTAILGALLRRDQHGVLFSFDTPLGNEPLDDARSGGHVLSSHVYLTSATGLFGLI